MRKKPDNYFGFAWSDPTEGYSKEYLLSKRGKKEIEKSKKRFKNLRKDQKKNGFDESEIWDLGSTICSFTLPRLKYFRENLNGHPSDLTIEKWKETLDKMIFSMEYYLEDNLELNIKESEKIQEGFKLFGIYIQNLWD